MLKEKMQQNTTYIRKKMLKIDIPSKRKKTIFIQPWNYHIRIYFNF